MEINESKCILKVTYDISLIQKALEATLMDSRSNTSWASQAIGLESLTD